MYVYNYLVRDVNCIRGCVIFLLIQSLFTHNISYNSDMSFLEQEEGLNIGNIYLPKSFITRTPLTLRCRRYDGSPQTRLGGS